VAEQPIPIQNENKLRYVVTVAVWRAGWAIRDWGIAIELSLYMRNLLETVIAA
jgi:hypothetical protein